MVIVEETDIVHYGILRRSGRYPWGSGGNVPQRSRSFLDITEELKRSGMSDSDIAKGFDIDLIDYRALKTIAKNAWRSAQIAWAQRLQDKGWSSTEISKKMEIPESTVRALLKPGADDKNMKIKSTADMLRREVEEKQLLDIGHGVENFLGISKERKNVAVTMLVDEGYKTHYVSEPQIGTGKMTNKKILALPDITSKEVYARRGEIRMPGQRSDDFGETWLGIKPPVPVSQSRIMINYAETGGGALDGVMYLRPGLSDLSMGGAQYGQVRIQVGKSHYLKGMAIYKDDLPDGVDIVFNSPKKASETPNKLDAMKPLTDDPQNPFGAMVDQITNSKGKVTSAVNLVNEQGDWSTWSNTLSSQVLSKQSPRLAKQQLNVTMERRLAEYNEIMSMTNLTVKKKLLQEFADATDAASVHLSAAALPGQRWHVVLPIPSLKDTEIYAPNYNTGDVVAVVRYPHGGTFEIPVLTVNNSNKEGKRTIGNEAQDAVGFNAKVAERLSGADFDGDTVLVIPNRKGDIRSTPALKELEGFDPKTSYPKYEGMVVMDKARKQQEMGDVSNLITDMTVKQASDQEIARAVRHSMVVIDATKKELNYRQSAIDNGIRSLKEKYQGGPRAGADTLISLAKSDARPLHRIDRRASEGGPIDPVTGRKVYTYTGESYVNKDGKRVQRTVSSPKMSETTDAHTLSSGTPMEAIYADHANRLKGLANQARLDVLATPRAKKDPSATKTYEKEVASLNAKLDLALRNAPLERQAQTLASHMLRAKKDANPQMDEETEKKIKYQLLETTRSRMGAGKLRVKFTQEEWDAIQAGAISDSKLSQILTHADMERVRELATPRTRTTMTPARTRRAATMLATGYTRAEVAAQLGISISTLDASLSVE